MALFSIQLARLLVTIVYLSNPGTYDDTLAAYYLIIGIHEMINVMIISIIATLSY